MPTSSSKCTAADLLKFGHPRRSRVVLEQPLLIEGLPDQKVQAIGTDPYLWQGLGAAHVLAQAGNGLNGLLPRLIDAQALKIKAHRDCQAGKLLGIAFPIKPHHIGKHERVGPAVGDADGGHEGGEVGEIGFDPLVHRGDATRFDPP